MSTKLRSIKDIPGWLVMVLLFGVLYVTGLHTEVIGQVQRLLLATGVMRPDLPDKEPKNLTTATIPATESVMAGESFILQTLDGEVVPFKSLKGKVIFLNFWATWCPPCIAEMPNIQSLHDKVASDKIAFVMISMDKAPEKAAKFIQKKGYNMPVYFPATNIPQAFSSSAIPTTFVISANGELVLKKEGMADYDTKEFRKFLIDLAK